MKLFNDETGEVLTHREGQCPHCVEEIQRRFDAEQDKRVVQDQLAKALREINRLKGELVKQQVGHPQARQAEAIFRYWLAVVKKDPGSKRHTFGDKRRKAVLARLNEHDAEYICRALDGFALTIYTAPNGKRFDDLELVCRDETKLEGCYELAERINAPSLLGPAWIREFGNVQDIS